MDNANKRIARNTLFLYFRTIVILLVSLYTSRVILEALGVTDLDIYNVVGGIVMLVSSIQAAQTNATSRFITFELGKKNSSSGDRQKVFSICLTIHIILAIIMLVFAETAGLFIVNKFVDIPSNRIYAANVIYQFSIVSLIFQLVRVPYGSVIVAHERMSIFAYFSIVEAILLLVIAVIVKHWGGDRLILYGFLVTLVSIILYCIYYLFVKHQFDDYRFKWIWNKTDSLKVLAFSGWTLLGSTSGTIEQQGISLLLNKFVGLVANTALGFASQVNVAVSKFVSSFNTAFNPQIIKYYASGETEKMFHLINRASKFSFMLCYFIALPLIANMGFVLDIWLKEVPQYTIEFCQLILACTIIDATTGVLNTSITATGRIKSFQIAISISFFCDFCMALMLLTLHVNPVFVFGVRIMMRGFINMLIEFYFTNQVLSFNIASYLREVMLPIVLTFMLTIPPVWFICMFTSGVQKFILSCLCASILNLVCLVCFIMNANERMAAIEMIREKFHRGS